MKPPKTLTQLEDSQLQGKQVLVRTDFNVPLEGGRVVSDHRIQAALPTLRYLLECQAKVVVVSHLGRPKGGVTPEFSLKPVFEHLQSLLPGVPMQLLPLPMNQAIPAAVEAMAPGSLVLLENIRFEPGETKNDPALSQQLADLADVYVNDAFGAAHRAHASTEGVARRVPLAVSGMLLNEELVRFNQLLESPPRPLVALLGGSKISTKIGVINHLLSVVDVLMIGGGMTYTFLKAQGFDVGTSIVELDQLDIARQAMERARSLGKTLLVPTDVVVANDFSPTAQHQVVSAEAIPEGWMGMDTGPESVKRIVEQLSQARSVIWNGPIGVFEMAPFATGTLTVAKTLAHLTKTQGVISVLGGGDTEAAVQTAGLSHADYTHVSTGGGASLELLEGIELPGVMALQPQPCLA